MPPRGVPTALCQRLYVQVLELLARTDKHLMTATDEEGSTGIHKAAQGNKAKAVHFLAKWKVGCGLRAVFQLCFAGLCCGVSALLSWFSVCACVCARARAIFVLRKRAPTFVVDSYALTAGGSLAPPPP
jgi:hypothetical protein